MPSRLGIFVSYEVSQTLPLASKVPEEMFLGSSKTIHMDSFLWVQDKTRLHRPRLDRTRQSFGTFNLTIYYC